MCVIGSGWFLLTLTRFDRHMRDQGETRMQMHDDEEKGGGKCEETCVIVDHVLTMLDVGQWRLDGTSKFP